MNPPAASATTSDDTHAVDPRALLEQLDLTFTDRPKSDSKSDRLVIAPGRVNLIGEHTDYNDGYVCPMAIEPSVILALRPTESPRVRIESCQFPGQRVEFDLTQPITANPDLHHWSNYIKAMAAELLSAGIPLTGLDVLIANTLPPGSGLSSSAAIEVGTARALLHVSGQSLDGRRLALLAQRAEHNFPQVKCGIMDQMIVANGRAGHAMLLDCRNLEAKFIPVDPEELRVVIVNSMHKHTLAADGDSLTTPDGKTHRGAPYNMRRLACETGVAAIARRHPAVRALRDATMAMLDEVRSELTELIYRRCRHVITEIDRCVKFGQLLSDRQFEQAGRLMFESHVSLRDDYEVSTDHLDALVEIARGIRGVYGSRMTGAGFGGCTVSLVRPRDVDAFKQSIQGGYQVRYGITPQVIITRATDGARVVG
jgi:galactokinase